MRTQSSPGSGRKRYAAAMLPLFLLGTLLGPASPTAAQETTAPVAAAEPAPETPAGVQAQDLAATGFMMKCAGCHTIGGGALTGPDLKNAMTYPRQTVWDAIKRMEKSVGPLAGEEVDSLTDFLLSPEAGARLVAQRKQVQMREAASLEPASAEKGRALFFGSTAFSNGGVACGACHQAGGRGGNMAASLEDAFTRLGEQPLLATAENPGFPVMRAIYTSHPVVKQESVHLVKFLEEVSKEPARPAAVPLLMIGGLGAVAVLLLLGKASGARAAGTRARLVAGANSRNARGHQRRRASQ